LVTTPTNSDSPGRPSRPSSAACGRPASTPFPVGFAGTEIVRRIIGFAHLTDLTTLPDPVPASRRALLLGHELIVRREELTTPDRIRALV
jgi:hypothetical protein